MTSLTTTPEVFEYVAGDMLPKISRVHRDAAGVAVNITGYTITMKFEQPDTTVKTVPAIITDAPNGAFEFGPFAAGDIVNGQSRAVITISNPSAEIESQQNIYLRVHRAL